MFVYAFILILFLPFAFLPLTIETLFSPAELGEMGISLEYSSTMEEHESIHMWASQSGRAALQMRDPYGKSMNKCKLPKSLANSTIVRAVPRYL